jgi:hypothetical protein
MPFLNNDAATVADHAREMTNRRDRIQFVHEEESADNRVDGLVERDLSGGCGRKDNSIEALAQRALCSLTNDERVGVGGNHASVAPDSLGYEERDFGESTAQNQDAHPRRNPRARKQLFGQRLSKSSLECMRFVGSEHHGFHFPLHALRAPRSNSHFGGASAAT